MYGKGRNGLGAIPYDRERGPHSEDRTAMEPPAGTGRRSRRNHRITLRGRAVQASDSEGSTDGLSDSHPVGGMQVGTPWNSGLFDTDDENMAELGVKLERGEENVQKDMPYEPTPDLNGGNEIDVKDVLGKKEVISNKTTEGRGRVPISNVCRDSNYASRRNPILRDTRSGEDVDRFRVPGRECRDGYL